jgi:amino acid transporter
MIMKIAFVLYLVGSLLGFLLVIIQIALKKRLDKARYKNTRQWLLPWYYIVTLWFMAFVAWNNYFPVHETKRHAFFIFLGGLLLFTVITGFLQMIIFYPSDPIIDRNKEAPDPDGKTAGGK